MMTTRVTCLLLFLAAKLTSGPVPVQAARILAIMSSPAKSHHIFFSGLPSALAARGHYVYLMDMQKPKIQPPTLNVTVYEFPPDEDNAGMASYVQILRKGSVLEKIKLTLQASVEDCENMLRQPTFQKLISPDFKEEFDLILLSYVFDECFLGFIHRFNYIPMVLASPFPKPSGLYRLLGNPLYHGIPHHFMDYPMPMTVWQRLTSLAIDAIDELCYYFYQEPGMNQVIRKVFGNNVPSVQELSKYISLGLVNLMDTSPKPPLVSNIIPVGGMHIPPVQPLEKKLKDFLDGAKDGAVIMSFGSLVRWYSMGDEKRDAVLKVFSRLPQRLIWKLDSENLTNIPPNVMIRRWLPQNDILAHPNIRLFISHCGGMSSTEAAYHGVPILGVPFIVDQYANAQQVVTSGAGLILPSEELTEETLYGNITEILKNTKYYNISRERRAVMQDQLVKPLDRAIYYVEYVLRHKGAFHLRSPLIDLPFRTHTLLMDIAIVTAMVVISMIILVAIFLEMARCLFRSVRRPRRSRTVVVIGAKKRS